MSRPKGSKNRATILREAEVSMVDIIERRGKEAFLDSLFVMEEGMRHYFSKAMQAKANNMKPEIVDNYMQKAIDVAEKVAPYRHARLSAVKLADDPNNSGNMGGGKLARSANFNASWRRAAQRNWLTFALRASLPPPMFPARG